MAGHAVLTAILEQDRLARAPRRRELADGEGFLDYGTSASSAWRTSSRPSA